MKPDRINRPEARRLADEEFRRFAEVTASLTSEDWAKLILHRLDVPQDGPPRARIGRRSGLGARVRPPATQRHPAQQADRLAPLGRRHERMADTRTRPSSPSTELVNQLGAVGPKAVKGRWGTPPPIRYLPIPFGVPVGWKPLKHLLDVGFTRDVWCHRIDICGAIGRPMQLTADHDGRLVADIVAEWADLHGQPFDLVLEGPAGGEVHRGRQRRASRDRRHRLHAHPLRSPPRHRPAQPFPPPLKETLP